MNSILYISSTNNIHDKRLIELFAEQFQVTPFVDVSDDDTFPSQIPQGYFDLIIYSPLSAPVPWDSIKFKSAYGLCMAYEIEESDSSKSSFDAIQRNITYSKLINFDNVYIEKVTRKSFEMHCLTTEIKYGCDIAFFFPSRKPKIISPTILCNRSWSKIHRNEDVLAALEMLCNDGVEFRSKFLEIPQDLTNLLVSYPKLAKSGKLKFFPNLSKVEMAKELSGADIFITASQSDGTSVSLLEAMANGKIVITTDFPANLEVISPGINGYTFKNRQPYDLYMTLKHVFGESHQKLDALSKSAHEYAIVHGDWTKESAKLICSIKNLVENTNDDK